MFLLIRAIVSSIMLFCFMANAAEQASPLPSLKFLKKQDRHLEAGGQQLTLLGFNRYELAGGPLTGACRKWGTQQQWWSWAQARIDDAAKMGANVIRLWAFQNFAGPSGTDFAALDKVIAYAKGKRIRVILTLSNQWADCDEGGIKDAAWFGGGYTKPYGRYKLSFNAYIDAIVNRYKNEPAVAMWQVMNEAKHYQNPAILKSFLTTAARRIKSIDKNHLVSGGAAIQCWQGRQGAADFQAFSNDSSIDVLDAHEYDDDHSAWPVCMSDAMAAAKALNKPLIIGESGIKAAPYGAKAQAVLMSAQKKAALDRGVAGFLIWSIGEQDGAGDGFDVAPSDDLNLRNARR